MTTKNALPDLLEAYQALRLRMLAELNRVDRDGDYSDAAADRNGWVRLTVDDCAARLREAAHVGAMEGGHESYRRALGYCGVEVPPMGAFDPEAPCRAQGGA